ncbi:MAG: pyrroline-5-carboxylate reductase, partial [Actinobacteria bacterium]|nr:pyrroline-5-carboxylate reductase [Actinomycetota bacterium]
MGEALISAIIKAGFSANEICISDKRNERLEELKSKHGCSPSSTEDAVSNSQNILLVVKPQDMDALLEKVGRGISNNQRVISFAAGKKTSGIEKYLNSGVPVLRVMPNTPMSVGIGASAIS